MLIFFKKGQDEVNITIEIKADDTPEVAEIFTVNLVNVSGMDRLQTGAVSTVYSNLFYLSVSTCGAIGQFCGPYFTVVGP